MWRPHPHDVRATTLLTFTVSGRLCALPAAAVREIVPFPALDQAPGQPTLFEGFLNLRGAAIPVLRLDRLFGWPPSEAGLYSHIVVLGGPEGPVGLLAGRAEDIAAYSPDAIHPLAPADSLNGCAGALVEEGGRTIYLLAPEGILLAAERRLMEEFRSREQERLDRLEAAGE
jgi:purine-binding chemotaxis protein CheW